MKESELTTILSKMKINKYLGLDGLPTEVYETLCHSLKTLLVDTYTEAFQTGELPSSQREAVLSPIFKKGNKTELQKW